VRKKRNKNAPGINGIPFLVYKKCPKVLKILLEIMNRVWSEKVVPHSWQQAVIVLLAKSDELNKPSEFRPIALLNAEGRLFFTLMNWRLSAYMLNNGYIDVSVQKGFIERLAGCVEHSETLHHAVLDARANKRNLCVSWLDLANAYGSVRHSMILFTLEWYWVPHEFAEVVFQYYEGLCAAVMVNSEITQSFRFQIGVFQGCTLSTMLFDTAFNTVFQRVSKLLQSHGYHYSDSDVVKVILGYADDIANMTHHRGHNQEIIQLIEEWLEWTQTMQAKPRKCKAMCLSKGKLVNPKLMIGGAELGYIDKEAFKFLGKQITSDGSAAAGKQKVKAELEKHAAKLDKTLLTGSQKMWIFDCVLMSMVSWDLLIHDMSPSFVEDLGALQTRMYKKWSHYAKTGNATVFYRRGVHFGLGMKEMVPFFKKMQLVKCHLLKTSTDDDVRTLYRARSEHEHSLKQSADPAMRHAWKPCVEMEPLLSEAKHRKMIKGAQSGTAGLGMAPAARKKDTKLGEERAEMLKVFEDRQEERRYLHGLNKEHFAAWVMWDSVLETNHDWTESIMAPEDDLFQFNLAATEDVLPTPSVLKCWRELSNATCPLCKTKASSLKHILCGCQVALKQGRQLWRHDSVLLAMYQSIRALRNRGAALFQKGVKPKQVQTSFVSDKGNKTRTKATTVAPTLFETSDDWELQFDVCVKCDGQTKNAPFPPHIVPSKVRPDGVIWSNKLKTVAWVELTSPWEENMTKWHFTKHDKYSRLAKQVRDAGWRAIPLCVEVGARGHINHRWHHFTKEFGIRRAASKALQKKVARVAQRCSYYLYCARKQLEWVPRPLLTSYGD
jgi:hypothetical protein